MRVSFLWAHGEKLFVAGAVVLAGWAFVDAVPRLLSRGSISAGEKRQIEDLEAHRPPPPIPPPRYQQQLAAAFARSAQGTGAPAARVFYPEPLVPPAPPRPQCAAMLGAPRDVGATADHDRATITWRRAETERVALVRYEVWRCDDAGAPRDLAGTVAPAPGPADAASPGTLVDDGVAPGATVTYAVRAIGRPAPRGDEVLVAAGLATTDEGHWISPWSLPARVTTPRDVEFEYPMAVVDESGTRRARLVVRKWDRAGRCWIRYGTGPGVAVGDRVVGTRAIDPAGGALETFETGFTVRRIVDEFRSAIERVDTPHGPEQRTTLALVQEVVLVGGGQTLVVRMGGAGARADAAR